MLHTLNQVGELVLLSAIGRLLHSHHLSLAPLVVRFELVPPAQLPLDLQKMHSYAVSLQQHFPLGQLASEVVELFYAKPYSVRTKLNS